MVDETDDSTLGYILVYVDDVLLIGLPNAVSSFYQWLAEKWECDELAILTKEKSGPVREVNHNNSPTLLWASR